MVDEETPKTSEMKKSVPLYSTIGILVGFALYHTSLAIFWQFGSFYLFTGIGESQLLLIGLVGGLPILVGMSALYLWGSFSDRWQRRKPFMVMGFVAFAFAFFTYIFVQDTITFLIVTCLAYLFSSAAVPMANAYLTQVQTRKGSAVGLLLATNSFGWSFGAFGGGFLFDIIGMLGLFFYGGIFFLIGSVIVLALVREIPYDPMTETESKNSISNEKSVKHFSAKFFLATLSLSLWIGIVGVSAFSYFFGVYLISEIGGTAVMLGIANGFASLLGLGITLVAGVASDRFGRKPVLLLGFVGWAIFMSIYSLVFDPWVAALLWTIPIYPLSYTAAMSAAADVSRYTRRGRAMAIVSTFYQFGSGIGPIIGGALVQLVTTSLRGTMVFAAILNLVAFLMVLVLLPESLKPTLE